MSYDRIRVFNKHITNRITRHFAHLSYGPFAMIRHVGRRSGKPYETPIMVEPNADGFVIALTYGEAVDWYRNVLAAGGATLFWHRKEYALGKPEAIDVNTALSFFSPFQRLILRRRRTQHFVKMKDRGNVRDNASLRDSSF